MFTISKTVVGKRVMDESSHMSVTEISNPLDMSKMKENIDAFFLMVMGIIVFFMQTGFGFLEAGSVRYDT